MNGFGALGEHAIGELPATLASVAALTTVYVASQGYAPKPYDAEAGRYYEGRVLTSITLEAGIEAGQGGRAGQVVGELRIWNGDGWLDGVLRAYAVDGREIRLATAPADGLAELDIWDMGDGAGPAGIVCDWGAGAGPADIICDHEALS